MLDSGSTEVRARIAVAAFGPGRMRFQDGPDLCHRKVVEAVAAAGDTATRRRSRSTRPLAGYAEGTERAEAPLVVLSVAGDHGHGEPAAPAARAFRPRGRGHPLPVLEGGQRVSHAIFGLGVMSSQSGGRTVISFDQDGPRGR